MKKAVLLASLLGLLPVVAIATPLRVLETGIPEPENSQRQDEFCLRYYNWCSGSVWLWMGYCNDAFCGHSPQYATCFDLADCPPQCRNLEYVCWAARAWYNYSQVDVEVYCADENACPVGAPIGGIYDYELQRLYFWHCFYFGGLPLCQCEATGGRFVVVISHGPYEWIDVYSDANSENIEAGCESEWRCSGHSYVYRNVVTYCDVHGAPGPLWVEGADYGCTNFPAIPPGCHDYVCDTGFYAEWLIKCYISCQGPTQTEKTTWSGVKAMYK
jgi:hypothetical protein